MNDTFRPPTEATPFADNDQLDLRAKNSELSSLEDAQALVAASLQEITSISPEINQKAQNEAIIGQAAHNVVRLRTNELDSTLDIFSEAA